MAILSVNAGSSTLKFSLYPLVGAQVQPQILSGCIEGLEPDGKPEMSWSFQGQTQRKRLELGVDRIFAQALQCLRELLSSLPDTPSLQAVAHRVRRDQPRPIW
ncbi:MAG: hypothetical protein GW790_09745 [Rhodoferax sp.]|nr:hypothetical protein [Rhodoferax sp.]